MYSVPTVLTFIFNTYNLRMKYKYMYELVVLSFSTDSYKHNFMLSTIQMKQKITGVVRLVESVEIVKRGGEKTGKNKRKNKKKSNSHRGCGGVDTLSAVEREGYAWKRDES